MTQTPVLRPERVGRGAAWALLAVPAGALVTGALWNVGLVSCVGGLVAGVLAVSLYARGSAGGVRRGVPLVVGVLLLALVVSFFTGVALDLWTSYRRLDAESASIFGSRWAYVTDNLFYPPLLERYPRTTALLVVLGALGASLAALVLRRARRR